MFKKITKISTILLIVFSCLISCSDRPRNNPLDPKANIKPDVNLSILSFNDRIELKWNETKLTDFKGYNIYKQNNPDSSFYMIARELLVYPIIFTDFNINYNTTYSYYLTIQGEDNESLPSNIVTTTPGPGYNWIVDKWGYQIIKTTYDVQHKMEEYFTNWRPEDIAIDTENNIALITQPTGRRIDIINIQTTNLEKFFTNEDRNFIENPYLVEFDSKNKLFWVTDSSGTIYRISSIDFSINLIQYYIVKPGEIFIQPNDEIVNIIDEFSKNIYQFDLNGNFIKIISEIGNHTLIKPKKFVIDSVDNQFWLVEEMDDNDYLYTGFLSNSQISLVDSFEYVFEIHLNPIDQLPWISVYEDGISSVMQLSKAGNRQLELTKTKFNNPYHVTHNPYDGSLLVSDSDNSRVIHFKEDFEILGIFTNLNFPIRLEIE
jgi:hypothetical protein